MEGRSARSPLWTAAALVVLIAGLHMAAAVLVPVVTAAMLAIICSPMVRELGKKRVPRPIAVVFVVVVLLMALGLAGVLVASSVAGFREQVPAYTKRFGELVGAVTAWLYNKGWISQASRLVDALEPGNLINKGVDLAGTWFAAATGLVEKALLVALTLVLILIEGETVPRRLRALSRDPHADISHFERIASDVQSYLAIKTVLSVITGLLIGGWAAVLGLDFALLWGLLGFLFNYIPNIGAVIAAIPPTLLALLLKGPGIALAFFGGTVAVHMVVGNLLEPMWMGRKLGLSITVVFLSLLFWGEVWGPVGMLLSVPLTMVIKILLEHSHEHRHLVALLDEGGTPRRPPVAPLGEAPDAPDAIAPDLDAEAAPAPTPSPPPAAVDAPPVDPVA